MQKYFILLFILMCSVSLRAQVTVSGTVFDNSRKNFVENVRVVSTGGMFTLTDSMGRYSILVMERDTISFFYNNKPTQKFPVARIANPRQFDISLRVDVISKYSLLKEVMLYSKSHRQDSLENRATYHDVFDYSRPGIETSVVPGGGVGADVNEIINIFRFRRNRNLKAFQARLEREEQEKYIDHRFNKLFVKRLTGLQDAKLDSFMRWYRPTFEFAKLSSEMAFNQYVLNAWYQFEKLVPKSKREE